MPSITDGLFAGRAGIQSHGTAISVLADNIANANTTGFKSSRADFADLLAGSLGGSSAATAGSGSTLLSVTPVFTQGSFESTGRGLDLAIDGNGFLVVEDTSGTGQRFYTRSGNLKVDKDGYVLNQNGYRVLGFPDTGAGGLSSLNVNQRTVSDVNTDSVTITGNLDASSSTTSVPSTVTFSNLSNAASFSTFVDVFDSLGASHTVTIYFFRTAANTWTVNAYVDADDVGGTAGSPSLLGTASLTFSSDGSRTTPVPSADITATPAWDNGSSTSDSITFSFDPFTQYASSSNISSLTQDGTGGGSVLSFSVQSDGTLFAQLDNGTTASIGTLALANFANVEGLERVGSSLYTESTSSGEPVIGTPDTGTFGSISAGSLELSTSDLASNFVKLISYQRGFQSSARVITNIDDLLNEIIQLA